MASIKRKENESFKAFKIRRKFEEMKENLSKNGKLWYESKKFGQIIKKEI